MTGWLLNDNQKGLGTKWYQPNTSTIYLPNSLEGLRISMKTTLRADGVPSLMRNGHLPNISLDVSIHQPITSTFMERIVWTYIHAMGYSTYGEVSCCVKLSFRVQWKSVKSAETLKSLENPLIAGFTVFSCKPYDSTQTASITSQTSTDFVRTQCLQTF